MNTGFVDLKHLNIVKYWFAAMQAALTKRGSVSLNVPSINCLNKPELSRRVFKFLDWQLNDYGVDYKVPFTNDSTDSYEINIIPNFAIPYSHPTRKLAILFSGGLDSTLATFHSEDIKGYDPDEISLYHIDYGSPYSTKEYEVACKLHKQYFAPLSFHHVRMAKCTWTEDQMHKGYIIPLRNTVLATVAAVSGVSEIWVTSNFRKIDDEPGAAIDKGRRFYGELSDILSMQLGRPITVASPFLHITKTQTLQAWMDRYAIREAQDLLNSVISCYSPQQGRCGRCSACMKMLALSLEQI
jgi:7-cyano-7-deazaguanine synthase in queuosine biosynthesis